MLNQKHLDFFEARGISAETASEAGVYSEGVELCFPTYDGADVINLKYRGPQKRFRQAPDGKQSFYNPQGLDLAIEEGKPLLIVEGEMDCLAVLESRYAWTVSIPCGAPGKEIDFYSVEDDNKFRFVWDAMPKLKQCKKFILAGDSDEAGRVLNAELTKRLGAENCKFIQYPDDCKDLNDVLLKHGPAKVNELINTARDIPVVGLFRPDEFPIIPADLKKVYPTTLGREHNHHLKLMLGKFMTVVGFAGHGKSTWTDGLVMNLAKAHNWNVCICSTEVDNEEFQEESYERYLNRPFEDVNADEQQRARDFYQSHYTFITNDTMDDEIELTLEKLLELATIAVLRDNAKIIQVDPWNEISHMRGQDSETDYTSKAIRMFKRFSKKYKVLVICVVHPSKPIKGGKNEPPSLYDISGSAHWANKSDFGVVIWRENIMSKITTIITAKIKRHGPMGYVGSWDCEFDERTRRFNEI